MRLGREEHAVGPERLARPPRLVVSAVVLGGWLLSACGADRGREARAAAREPLLVLAAANLTRALEAAVPAYEASAGEDVTVVFGSSGNLAAQIRHGAPADVYISANEAFLDGLLADGRIEADSRAEVVVGPLALVVPPGRNLPDGLEALSDRSYRMVAVANPEHAPYGVAARAALEAAGVWMALDGRLVMGENVAQTLQYVRTGNADAGLVALSLLLPGDPEAEDPVPHLIVDPSLHAPILQVGGIVSGSPRAGRGRAFLAWLTGPGGSEILRRYGFEAPTS